MKSVLRACSRVITSLTSAATVLLCVLASAPSHAAWQIYEPFSGDPGWDGLNNRTAPQNFGHSLTNNTGGGDFFEAGGTIVREDNPRAYYGADIGSLTLNDRLKVTGKINAHTPGGGTIFIGYFNNSSAGYPQNNTLGLYLDGQGSSTNVYVRTVSSGGIDNRTGPHTTLPLNTDMTFQIFYDPAANGGNGAVTVTIGGVPYTSALPAGLKSNGAIFNRFGIHNVGVDGGPFVAYVDDLSYTSSTPKVERFTVDPGWDGHNSRIYAPRLIRHAFGFSSTNLAGGSVGEVGGRLTPAGEPAYYAKVLPLKSFNDSMSASGKLRVNANCPNPDDPNDPYDGGNSLLGFFYNGTVNEWRTQNSIALRINGVGSDFRAYVEYGTDLWRTSSSGDFQFAANQTYNWSLTYDPNGNGGNGVVTGVIGGQTIVVPLGIGHKADTGNFNRFGVLNVVKSADDPGCLWIDDVTVDGVVHNFNSNPNWEAHGNSNYLSNNVRFNFDFGYSIGTSFAGGQGAGEMGGFMFRGDSRQAGTMAFYGAELGETLSLNTPLHAEGRVAFRRGVTDSSTLIGFFNNTDSVRVSAQQANGIPENFVGVSIEGPSSDGFLFSPIYGIDVEGQGSSCRTCDGGVTPPTIYPDGDGHNWTLDYNPNGGNGQGQITVALDEQQVVLTLQPGHKSLGATFNRFGLITTHVDGNGQTIYFDDLIWTNALPP